MEAEIVSPPNVSLSSAEKGPEIFFLFVLKPFLVLNWFFRVDFLQKPQLISGGKKFYQFLREHCPVVSETYYPTFWCWESRIQTLLRPFVTAKPGVVYRK